MRFLSKLPELPRVRADTRTSFPAISVSSQRFRETGEGQTAAVTSGPTAARQRNH
jgi:hypothetical protein